MLALVVGGWSAPVTVTGTIDGQPGTGSMLVYLPGSLREGERLPLVIALHGWDHSPQLWRKKGDLAAWAEQHRLVLAVPQLGQSVYETALYPESRGKWTTAPGARWVAEVILPWVRAHYPVAPGRARTAVIGYSTGGRGAVLLAEAYPEFAFAGSLSGTYDLLRLGPAEGEYKIHAAVYGARDAFAARWELDNVVAPARLEKLTGTRLFIAHGGKDRIVKPDQLEALREALKGRPVEAEFVVAADEGHDWKFWNAQWGRLFEALAQTVSRPDPRQRRRRSPARPGRYRSPLSRLRRARSAHPEGDADDRLLTACRFRSSER